MTDKELLELAAKAAGIKYSLKDAAQHWEQYGIPLPMTMSHESPTYWNPLTDDGDAFRLAIKLGLLIDTDYNNGIGVGSADFDESWQPHANDKYAAARRAIVSAAATLGEFK